MTNKFKMKKSLGQNFLNDVGIVKKIVSIANVEGADVLEIGPGQGALTDEIIKYSNKNLIVELDDRLIPYLNRKYENNDKIKILHKDFLETTSDDFNFLSGDIKVVANLPYYITTAIILKIIEKYNNVSEIYVMVQKEVALRYASEYKKKTYGSISVFLQSVMNIKYEFTVGKEFFHPMPKIDSAIISLKKKDSKIDDLNDYSEFLKNCFFQKRKLLANNLSKTYNIDKVVILEFILDMGYERTIRPEEIEVIEYLELYEEFKKIRSIYVK